MCITSSLLHIYLSVIWYDMMRLLIIICAVKCSWAMARCFISQQHPSRCTRVSATNWCWQVLVDGFDFRCCLCTVNLDADLYEVCVFVCHSLLGVVCYVCTFLDWWAPYGLRGSTAPWFMCWFRRYINCLCVYITSFLSSFFTIFLMLFYLFTSLLVYFLTYQSTSSGIDPFRFQAGSRRRRPYLALVFGFILCYSIFCYGCMFAFLVFVSVCQY